VFGACASHPLCCVCKESISDAKGGGSLRKSHAAAQFPYHTGSVTVCTECGVRWHSTCQPSGGADTLLCQQCAPGTVMGTFWVPLGDISVDDGVLAIMNGSANFPGVNGCVCHECCFTVLNYNITNRTTIRGTQLPVGYAKNAIGKHWCVGPYRAGDLVLFNIKSVFTCWW
jgi:hypothetical protein